MEDAGPRPLLAAAANWQPVWVRGRGPRRRPGSMPGDTEASSLATPPALAPHPEGGSVPSPAAKSPAPRHRQLAVGLGRAEDRRKGGKSPSPPVSVRDCSLRSPPAARVRTGVGADGEVCFAQI